MVKRALEMASASAARQLNSKTANPKFKAVHEEDIRLYTVAINSLTDAK